MAEQAAGAPRKVGSRRAPTLALALGLALSVVVLFAPDTGGVPGFPGVDKIVHVSLFALLAGTACWRFGVRPPVLAVLASYGVLSEVIQALALPHRSGDWRDVVADVCGVVVGALILARHTAPIDPR